MHSLNHGAVLVLVLVLLNRPRSPCILEDCCNSCMLAAVGDTAKVLHSRTVMRGGEVKEARVGNPARHTQRCNTSHPTQNEWAPPWAGQLTPGELF